jgi:hypothetical protein
MREGSWSRKRSTVQPWYSPFRRMHVPSGWLWIDEGGLVEQEALDRAAGQRDESLWARRYQEAE